MDLACGKALGGRLAGSEAVPPLLVCWLLVVEWWEWWELREADREWEDFMEGGGSPVSGRLDPKCDIPMSATLVARVECCEM